MVVACLGSFALEKHFDHQTGTGFHLIPLLVCAIPLDSTGLLLQGKPGETRILALLSGLRRSTLRRKNPSQKPMGGA